jgi:hypothetical protein
VEWERRSDETKRTSERKEGNGEDIHRQRSNDLTKQEREIQKKLRTIAKEEKREGKEVKVGYTQITIEEVQWR